MAGLTDRVTESETFCRLPGYSALRLSATGVANLLSQSLQVVLGGQEFLVFEISGF
jgi:hypothetical protein